MCCPTGEIHSLIDNPWRGASGRACQIGSRASIDRVGFEPGGDPAPAATLTGG